MFLSKLFENQLATAFDKYGRFIARNPGSAILFCVMLNGLLGINIIWIKSNSNLESVYTPTNSKAAKDSKLIKNLFPDYTGTNFYQQSLHDLGRYGSLIIQSKKDNNILNSTYEYEIRKTLQKIENVTVTEEGRVYSYDELCARRNNTCVSSKSVLISDYFWEQVRTRNVTFPQFLTVEGRIENLDQTFGGVELKDGVINSAKAIKISFYLRQDDSLQASLAARWERKFLTYFGSLRNENISVAYATSESLGEELDANTDGDVTYFSLSFTLMITYASFVSAGGNCVSQRGHLGRAGVIASGLAILGAFGLGSACQIEFVNIVGVMPFLIIGIGVDDMFVLMSALADAPINKSPEERIGKTVQSSGVAVTITSLTNVAAFAAGTSSSFQSVRNFCFYCGMAVLLCYINQMTFFLGCMSFHERRVADNRHCITCFRVKNANILQQDKAGNCQLFCCSGSPPSSRNDQESFLEKLPSVILPKVVLWIPVKIAIILGFCAYVALSIWGTINLKQGLLLRNLVSETSYYHFYSNADYDYFPTTFVISFIIPQDSDYSTFTMQKELEKFLKRVNSDTNIDSRTNINWLSAFMASNLYTNSSLCQFSSQLKLFLEQNPMYANDVQFGINCTIPSSRFHVITNDIKDSFDQGQLMLRMRKLTEESHLEVLSFSPAFIYFEQYVAVLPNTLQTVGISVAAVFVMTCIFLSNPLVILFVTLSMATIMLGLFGFMHICGLSLSSITMIHIIMSVGFSVDYSAHICHAYLTVEGDDRNSRVSEAIVRSGGPIFNGAVSSLIGIITLVFSESYVFTSFFKIMVLVIAFGLGQGVFLLPVLLSIIGPLHKPKEEKTLVYAQEEGGHINTSFAI